MVVKASWDGACVDGFISGRGELTMGPMTYTGEFTRGEMVSGKLVFPDGFGSFEGEFKNNWPAGRGVATRPEQTVRGVFDKGGQMIGPVVAEYSDGSRYEGEMDRDRGKQGKGRRIMPGGDYYDGEFQNNLRHGTGTWASPSGWTYTGQYAFGYRDGRGTEVFPDGSRYEGESKAGERHGHGRFTEASGGVQEGEWLAGKGTLNIGPLTYTGEFLVASQPPQFRLNPAPSSTTALMCESFR